MAPDILRAIAAANAIQATNAIHAVNATRRRNAIARRDAIRHRNAICRPDAIAAADATTHRPGTPFSLTTSSKKQQDNPTDATPGHHPATPGKEVR